MESHQILKNKKGINYCSSCEKCSNAFNKPLTEK